MDKYIHDMPTADSVFDAVVLAAGDYPSAEIAASILARADRVVCCDGAAVEFIREGGVPYAIVGDCDSLPEEVRCGYADIIHRDGDQETNDLTKAIGFCVAEGFRDVAILGATGKREDHTIGNIGLLPGYIGESGLRSVRMVTDRGVFDAISGDCRFGSFAGQQVSIFCPDPAVKITTRGLVYPLRDANLGAWWRGTLNESEGGSFGIGTTGEAIIYRLFGR